MYNKNKNEKMTVKPDFLWYKLFNAEGFGDKSIFIVYNTIKNHNISLEEVFKMDESKFRETFPKLGRDRLNKANIDSIQKVNEKTDELYNEYQDLKSEGVEIIYPEHELFPKRILEFKISPILFCKGNLSLLNSSGVAIVGSRNASEEGLNIARKFASELAMQGKNVISGYAKGIDTNAHLGALEKDGTTTIVLSYGILEFSRKKIFKNENSGWRRNVLIVSQFHPKAKWSSKNAMIRNKLICALSSAMIVIESGPEKDEKGKMSGTFHAGKTALDNKVPLFVVDPDYFRNPPPGNKELIKLGGIKIKPEDGVETILKYFKTASKQEQPSLF